MGKRRDKRERSSSNPTNFVNRKKISTEPQHQQPIASSAQCRDQPRNHSPYELPDPWLPNTWNHQPTYPNPWLPVHWDQQANYGYPCWPYRKTYQGEYMVDPWSHFYLYSVPHQLPSTVSPYYRKNDNLASHCQSNAEAHKHCTNSSGTLTAVSVNTDATLSFSKDATNTVDLEATLPSSNKTNTLNGSSKRVSKDPPPLRIVKMNSIGGLQVHVENNAEEDVHYLYSVEPTQGRLVELVDLSEDFHVSSNTGLLDPKSKNSYMTVNSNSETSDYTSLKGYTGDNTYNTLINNEKGGYSQNTHIEHYGDACCNICHKSLIQLQHNKCDLYSARCGHLFCVFCIKRLKNQKKCMKCNEAMSSLRKIVL